jgi:hypothetical protein
VIDFTRDQERLLHAVASPAAVPNSRTQTLDAVLRASKDLQRLKAPVSGIVAVSGGAPNGVRLRVHAPCDETDLQVLRFRRASKRRRARVGVETVRRTDAINPTMPGSFQDWQREARPFESIAAFTCPGFGSKGEVDLKLDVGTVEPGEYGVTSPPAVIGSRVAVCPTAPDFGVGSL